MGIFRSRTNTNKIITLLAFVLWVSLSVIGAQSFLVPSASTLSSNNVNVDVNVINGVTIHVLDKTATTEITRLDLALEAIPTGSFISDYFNVDVATSNKTGYKLYMNSNYQDTSTSPATYTTALVNQVDSSATIPTLTANTTKTDFSTAAPGTTNANKWGYSLDDTIYSPIPAHTSSTEIASGDAPTTSTLVPVYIAANVNLDKPSGTYKNQLTFSAIANPIPTDYSLHFLPGTTDTVTDLPSDQTASEVSASHTFTIPSTAPSRTGYNFTGYLDESTSTIYQPGDTITVLGDEEYTGSATLTAQWEEGCPAGANRICFIANAPSGTVSGTMEDQTIVYMTSSTAANTVDETTLSSSTTELTLYSPNWTLSGYGFKGWNTKADGTGTMYGPNQTITLTSDQQTQLGTYGLPIYAQWVASTGTMESFSCSSLTNVGDVTALTYGSDTYAITKLADGKCWMIENLRLDDASSTTSSTGTGAKTTSFSTSEYNLRQYNVTNVDGAAGAYPINLTSPAGATYTTNQYQWKSYGGYYSWASAIGNSTAHETQYGNPDSVTGSVQGICPSGWRLPRAYYNSATTGAQADFTYLTTSLGGSGQVLSNKLRTYPNNFVFAGYWGGSSSNLRGTYGCYWSSTVYNSNSAYRLYFDSTSVSPASPFFKRLGLSFRCVIGS